MSSSSIPWWNTLQRRVGENGIAIFCLLALALLPLPAAAHTATRAAQKPVAAFDYNPLTSLKANPTITGSATSSVPLHFRVTDAKGVVVYDDLAVWLSEGHFSETIYPPIPNGTYQMVMLAGTSTVATSTLTIGLRALANLTADDSLSASDVADGHLMRFSIRAHGPGGVGISQLSFTVLPNSADVADMFLYGYIDPNFTQPIVASGTDPLMLAPSEISATSSSITIVPDEPIEIPADRTYYFDLVGTVTPLDTAYNVETTLRGDTNAHFAVYADLASTSNFIWSPNTYGTSSLDTHDWTNSALIAGIPREGLAAVRTNAPPTNAPTCSMQASTTTAPAGAPVTLSWSSTGATSAVWDSGVKELVAGSKMYTHGTTTHTYILDFYGPYGFTGCYATVAMPYVAATTTATSTPIDRFTATPTTGPISLAVTFTGSVNNAKLCTAQTYSLGYGDGATSTIAVASNVCKAQSFTFVHTYTKVGTFTAGLYKGTGTSSTQRIQTQVIIPKAKVAGFFSGSSNLANILSAFNAFLQWIKKNF